MQPSSHIIDRHAAEDVVFSEVERFVKTGLNHPIKTDICLEDLGITQEQLPALAERIVDRSRLYALEAIGTIMSHVETVGDLVRNLLALAPHAMVLTEEDGE